MITYPRSHVQDLSRRVYRNAIKGVWGGAWDSRNNEHPPGAEWSEASRGEVRGGM